MTSERREKFADKMLYKVKLTDIETQRVFYDKLTTIYLEMPKFHKTESELETRFDQWLYVLKNLPHLEKYPARLRDRVFKKWFEVAEIAAFTPVERVAYEESVKIYRDLKNVMDTAIEESYSKGKLEGKIEGKLEIAKEMAAAGIDPEMIRRITGVSGG